MKPTIKEINAYIDEFVNVPETVELDYLGIPIVIKTKLTIGEMNEFVNRVVEESFIDSYIPSDINTRVAFMVTFMMMCTDIEIPKREIDGEMYIDSQATHDMGIALDIITKFESSVRDSYIGNLWEAIDKRIAFENQKNIAIIAQNGASDEAIETFNLVMNKGADLIDTAINQLEKSGNKLFKNLTAKKINAWVNDLQKVVADKIIEENK